MARDNSVVCPLGHQRHYSHDIIWPIAIEIRVLEGKSKHILHPLRGKERSLPATEL